MQFRQRVQGLKMSDVPHSTKIKMLMDAGYHFDADQVHFKYVQLVDFVKKMISHSCCACCPECCIACDAKQLLYSIGEHHESTF